MTCVVIRGCNILPRNELHGSFQVKNVQQWPFGLFLEVLGHCFTYFSGTGGSLLVRTTLESPNELGSFAKGYRTQLWVVQLKPS